MIIGIGTDLVEIARIETQLQRHGDRLAERVLTADELNEYRNAASPARLLAKRFAVKEAASKALGTGIGRGIGFHQMHVLHDEMGRPKLVLEGAALERARALGMCRTHVTLSDERHYAVAHVILEGS